MRRSTAAFLALAFSFSAAPGQNPQWKWVLGKLRNEHAQKDYRAHAKEIFQYYQKRGAMLGQCIEESEYDVDTRHVVFLGPMVAFQHPERFGLSLVRHRHGSLKIAGVTLNPARVGLFLRNARRTRILYTGMSPRGYRDIFAIPTGSNACTITEDGRVKFTGNYRDGKLELRRPGFSPEFPSADQLQRVRVPKASIQATSVYESEDQLSLDSKFKKRLAELTDHNLVLFVGESHWNTGVNQLFNRILEHTLRTREVSAVFLEINYSFTAFLDHYVTLGDEEARAFLHKIIHPLVNTRSFLRTLDIVRAHNLTHKSARVHIACLDLEWNSATVMSLIKKATRNKKEKQDFITKSFVANVERNLADTRRIGNDRAARQRAIVRNIREFHGKLLGKKLAIFKGGSFHAIKRSLPGQGFQRDAAYLHNTHPSTKGHVATLWLRGVGYGFVDVAAIQPRNRLSSASKYHQLIAEFRKGLATGTARKDAFYLINGRLSPIDTLILRRAMDLETETLWVQDLDERLTAHTRENVEKHASQSFDVTVYVFRSQLERTRPKRIEGLK